MLRVSFCLGCVEVSSSTPIIEEISEESSCRMLCMCVIRQGVSAELSVRVWECVVLVCRRLHLHRAQCFFVLESGI